MGLRILAETSPGEVGVAVAAGGGPLDHATRGPGPAHRGGDRHAAAPVLGDDAALRAALRPRLGERLASTRKAFDEVVADQVAELAAHAMTLPSGARFHVHPTPALTAIDVDGGAAGGEKG